MAHEKLSSRSEKSKFLGALSVMAGNNDGTGARGFTNHATVALELHGGQWAAAQEEPTAASAAGNPNRAIMILLMLHLQMLAKTQAPRGSVRS
jgi:hypothetical protein